MQKEALKLKPVGNLGGVLVPKSKALDLFLQTKLQLLGAFYPPSQMACFLAKIPRENSLTSQKDGHLPGQTGARISCLG